MTSQKILVVKALILETSFVSMYNQNIARIETSGNDASKAPIKVLRLAISEITTIKTVVMAILMM